MADAQVEGSLGRIRSVDLFRLVAIFSVVAIHASPFRADLPRQDRLYEFLDIAIDQTARFAVPFFFAISGYFWGVKARLTGDPVSLATTMAKRVSVIFLAWSAIYLLPLNFSSIYEYGVFGPIKLVYWNIVTLAGDPLTLLMQGTSVHLWFLVSLICSVYICSFFVKHGLTKTLMVISLAFYCFGLLSKAYVDTPLGIAVPFNARNGPFFGLLPFVSGYVMSRFKPESRWLLFGSVVFVSGLLMQFSELFVLYKYFGTKPMQDFVVGTYFMGLGFAIASLSNHRSLQWKYPSLVGKMTLGIYAIHYLYVEILQVIDKRVDSPLWEIGYVLIVFYLSIASVQWMSRRPILKRLIM